MKAGIRFIKGIREKFDLPIMIVSRQKDELYKIQGLRAGADDYVVMPCSVLEVKARIKAQLRRYTQLGCAKNKESATFWVRQLCLNDDTKKVTVNGNEVKLTPIEYKIRHIREKIENNPQKPEYLQVVWGAGYKVG